MRARTPRAIRRRGPVAPRIPPNLSRHTQTRPTDISTDPTPYPPLVETCPGGAPTGGSGGAQNGGPGGAPRGEKNFKLSRLGELLNTQKNVHFFAPPLRGPPRGAPQRGAPGGSQYYKIIPFWPGNGQIWARAPGGEISPPGAPRGPPGPGGPPGPRPPRGGPPGGAPRGGSRRGVRRGSQKGVPKGGPQWGPG